MSDTVLTFNTVKSFQKFILEFYHHHGRHHLPWRQNHDPYLIMVSEIMLQQTQVDRVIPKFNEFIKIFPTVKDLASASLTDVITHWQGLGYNRRAKYLHQAAQKIMKDFNGTMPQATTELLSLPGIGAYTAAAIQAFAFNRPVSLIETNVRTVYLYHFFPNQENIHDTQLEPLVTQTIDTTNPRQWYAALMDYGSYLKSIQPNPSRRSKHYAKQSKFHGSRRQVRGEVLRLLTTQGALTYDQLLGTMTSDTTQLKEVLSDLETEGFIQLTKTTYSLKHG